MADTPIQTVIDEIAAHNLRLKQIWQNVWGWGPNEAAQLLEDSRLDWIVSLSHTPWAMGR